MKSFLSACIATTAMAFGLSAMAFTTSGDKSNHTFASLSELAGSGVSRNGNIFTVTEDITIAPTDTLTMDGGGIEVAVGPGVTIRVEGYVRFTPTVNAVIRGIDGADAPKGVRLGGESRGAFRNLTFHGAALTSLTQMGFTVEECTFEAVGSASSTVGALGFNDSCPEALVKDCIFTGNEIPAVGTAANAFCGLTIANCTFTDNNTSNTNKPMLNLTSPGENGPMTLRDNTVVGAGRNMVGGISVSNFYGAPAYGHVIIEGNTVDGCRYGINCLGAMTAELRNNTVSNNIYESNPMNGGSGISFTDNSGLMEAVLSGNRIERNIWGITLIGYSKGFKEISLGGPAVGAMDSPGGNVFVDNGNDGKVFDPATPYDLYNNSPYTVYAQGNTWSVAEQTPEQIEKVIFHKADNPALGEVIYTDSQTAIQVPEFDPGQSSLIYSLDGRRAVAAPGHNLTPGLYIVVTGGKASKLIVE